MNPKSVYTFHTSNDGTLVIEDSSSSDDMFMSVTNNMENVLKEIRGATGAIPRFCVYRDTDGVYDGVEYTGDRTSVNFICLNDDNEESACARLKAITAGRS